MTTVDRLCPDFSPVSLVRADDAATLDPAPLRKPNIRRNSIVAVTLALLVLLIGFWPFFESPGSAMDEGTLLVYPEMLMHGKLPYRDYETFYGPANPAFLAAAFSAFGTNIFVERTVGLFYRLLVLLAIFAITRCWGNTIALGCLALTGCLLLGTYLPAFAWFGAMVCALWSLWLSSRSDSKLRCFFGGALAGLALLFRPDVGPSMILGALPLLHAMTWPTRGRYFTGVGLALLPLGVLTLFAGWHPVFDNLFLVSVFYAGLARHLPLLSATSALVTLFVVHLIASAVNVVAGTVAVRSQPRDGRARLLLGVALLGLGLTHQAASRLDSLHLLFVAFISLGILPLSLMVLGSRIRNSVPRTTEALLATITVVAMLQAIAPELTLMTRDAFASGLHFEAESTFVRRDGRSFPFKRQEAAATVARMLSKLDALSRPGQRLFVGPADLRRTNYNDTFLYHLMPKLTPATYFLEMNPRSANRPGSRLAADVQSADWLVLDRAWDPWDEPNRSLEYASNEANAVIRKEFDVHQEFGPLVLLRRKSQTVLSVHH
jgi:hypothetical protein